MQYVPFVAILLAYILVYVPRVGIVAKAMTAQPGGYNNSDPRAAIALLDGPARRAQNAHNNGFETFAPFAVAVFMASRSGKLNLISILCIAFVALRATYIWAYITNNAKLRSPVWFLGAACTLALMVIGIIG
jgi:uncharacterized MAPEG superfamily protein